MPLPDYYETLQVSENADPDIIQAAYRRLCLKYHPDRNLDPAADQKMRHMNEAYETLSNPDRRRAYDAARKQASANNGPQATSAPPPPDNAPIDGIAILLGALKAIFPPVKPNYKTGATMMGGVAVVVCYRSLTGTPNTSIDDILVLGLGTYVALGSFFSTHWQYRIPESPALRPTTWNTVSPQEQRSLIAAWMWFVLAWVIGGVFAPGIYYFGYLRGRDGSKDVVGLVQAAELHHKNRELDKALQAYTQAIFLIEKFPDELKKRWASIYVRRANVYADKRDWDKAISDCNTAISLDNRNAFAYLNRGQAYRIIGNAGKADSDYQEAVRIDPKLARPRQP